MQFHTESNDRIVVVSLTGRLDFGTSPALLNVLEKAVADLRGRPLVVDCEGLEYVSSTGLRSFLIGARSAQAVGSKFLICGLRKMVAEVFEVSGFSKLLLVFPDRVAAEAAVGA
jgi:anti-anti-sigma factor